MTTIAITGSGGFLGWHLQVHCHAKPEIKILQVDREGFRDSAHFQQVIRQADAVVHLAGLNRGEDQDIERVNVELTNQLIIACRQTGARPHVLLANSTHQDRDTAYGRSKRKSAALLGGWAEEMGAIFTDLVIPNVYGEGGRPFYNSVVATFCHQLASEEEPKIIQDGQLELVHAQQVSRAIVAAIEGRVSGRVQVDGDRLSVSETLRKLQGFDRSYRSHLVPELTADLDLDLFNTYRSFLYPRYFPVTLQLHSDSRGHLFEAVKSLHGGQCFISTTKPGITRGNHYHTRKFERFLVLAGDAVIRMRKLLTRDILEFKVSGTVPQYIDMPTFWTHDITNTGQGELTTLFWAHEIFDPQRSDTIREPVGI